MGQCESAVSDTRLAETELEIIKLSGIPLSELEVSSIYLNIDGDFARTIRCGNREGETLVLVHGYGGSGLVFYKIMKDLAEHFNLYLVDIIGMGASSRPKFDAKTADEADDYFVNFLETWRQKVELDNFYLAEHSFGGYVCGQYACKYPQHLKKLLMLSPAGVVHVAPDFDISQMTFKNGKKPGKLLKSIAKSVWEKKWSPFGIMRGAGQCMGKKIIKSYLNKRMSSLPKDEFDAMLNYMHQILMREGSTEYAIFICFKLGMFAHNALEVESRLGNPDFPIPISFYYGDIDWMDPKGGQRTIERNKFFADGVSQLYMITNSDHHMYLDNPDEFVQQIVQDIYMTEEKLYKKDVNSLNNRVSVQLGNPMRGLSLKDDSNILIDEDTDHEEAKQKEMLSL